MDPVRAGVVSLGRQESPRPHMQRKPVNSDTALAQGGLQSRRKMQSRRGRGDGAFVGRKYRLVVGGVTLVGRPPGGNVRRQRGAAQIRDRLIERGTMK